MVDGASDGERWPRGRAALLLLVAPLLVFGPMMALGHAFLPYDPVGLEPLASERPEDAEEAFRGANIILGDRIFHILADQIALRDGVREGTLPTWNPLFGMGMPLLGGTITSAFYPANWLALALPPELAAAPLALLSLLLAGLGAFLFFRRLGLAFGACAVGAVAMQLGGWGLANLYYFMKVDAALWLPWGLWAIEGLVRRERGSGLVLFAATALTLVSGMVTISAFVIGFWAVYAAWRCSPLAGVTTPATGSAEGHGKRTLLLTGGFLASGMLGASVYLLPLFESSRHSLRDTVDTQDLVDQSLPVATSLGFVVPDLVAAPTDRALIGQYPIAWWLTPADQSTRAELSNALEWNTYAGAAVFVLALVGLVARPRRALAPAVALVVVIAFAQAWPVARWLYAVPGLNFGAPGRILALAWFLWPWLAALGVDAVLARLPRAVPTLVAGSLALAAGAAVWWSGTEPEAWATGLEAALVERYGESHDVTVDVIRERFPRATSTAAGAHLADSLLRLLAASLMLTAASFAVALAVRRSPGGPAPRGALAATLAIVLALGAGPVFARATHAEFGPPAGLLAVAAVGVLVALGWTARGRAAAWLPLAAAVAVEGLLASPGHVGGRPIGPDGVFPPSAALDAVREAAGDGRALRLDVSESGHDEVVRLARPDMLLPYGVPDLMCYPLLTPASLVELFATIDPRTTYRNHVSHLPDPSQLGHPILDLVRARAVLSVHPLEHERLEPILERPGFHVYRRHGALPPARVVPEGVVLASDADVLASLAADELDFSRRTLVAPEFASVAAESPADPGLEAAFRPGTLRVERPAANRLDVEVTDSSGGWLVMHEQWAPGWRATIDGREVPLVRADHACRAVRVPAGSCRVETRYAPLSMRLGAGLGVVGLLLALVFGHLARRAAT